MEEITGTMTIKNPGRNLPATERWLSAVMGIVAALYGLREKDAPSLGLLAAGGYLLYRGVTGRCPLYELLGDYDRADGDLAPVEETPPASVKKGDEVTESSWESFPTSDPPSWTTGREQLE